jgi:hypothetical protein
MRAKDPNVSSDRHSMDPISGTGPQVDTVAVYEALVARRAMTQQRVEGQAALRLIETAVAPSQTQGTLPPDATISLRV